MLKPGYKQTDLGVLPEEWEVKILAPYIQITSGMSPSLFQFYDSGKPYFKVEQLNSEDKYIRNTPYLIKSKYNVLAGSIIFPKRGASIMLNKVKLLERDSFMDTNLMALTVQGELNKEYLFYWLSFYKLSQVADTTSIPQINNKHINPIIFPFPPPAEQQAIAEALGAVDALLREQRALLAKKRDLKQATQQALLTRARRLPGFSGKWEEKNFGDVITGFSSGATPFRGNKHYYNGKIKWVTSGELNYNVITETVEHISTEAANRTNLRLLPKGTFLMAITGLEAAGTRGSCGILGTEATTNQSCMALFPGKELLTDYLFHYYVHYGDELAFRYCQGTKQQSYTGKIVKLLPIFLPPVDEQRAIVEVLNSMDAETENLAVQLAKTEALKQGLMQDLLTGTIRLTEATITTTV